MKNQFRNLPFILLRQQGSQILDSIVDVESTTPLDYRNDKNNQTFTDRSSHSLLL